VRRGQVCKDRAAGLSPRAADATTPAVVCTANHDGVEAQARARLRRIESRRIRLLEPAQRLNRKVLVMWWTIAAGVGLLIAAVGAVVVTRELVPGNIVRPVGAVGLTLAVAGPYVRYRRWRYEIRERDLFLARGGIFITRTLIPFDRIQFVETREGPLDHVFGLQQLVVYTAAGRAGLIPGLAVAEAQAIREELSTVAGTSAV
jgi:uncharacterized protein